MTDHRSNALNRIAAEMAKPITHTVLIAYSDGTVNRTDMRSLAAAENFASRYRPLIGSHEYISRSTGAKIKIASVEVLAAA